MNKAQKLKSGDKIAIVSLSSGILGEPFIKHELDLGIKRLKEFGLKPIFMPNALKGLDFIQAHPEARAADLKQAFADKSIKAIMCAIGGDDSFRNLPYLLGDKEFAKTVKENPKIFTGFSDSTVGHLTLYKLGLQTFYGPCFLVDMAELDTNMLEYTEKWFKKYFENDKKTEVKISESWFSERENFSPAQLGTSAKENKETHGFETLQGHGKVVGKLLGGCIESLYDILMGTRHPEEIAVCKKYKLFPSLKEWDNKIAFFETSEERPTPKSLEIMLLKLKEYGVFDKIKGLIVGKPQNEQYYEEYKKVYKKVLKGYDLPILYNVNFGHSNPRCIIPYGVKTQVDYDNKTITYLENLLN